MGESDELILLCRSLTINRDGDYLLNSSKISLSLKKNVLLNFKVLPMERRRRK